MLNGSRARTWVSHHALLARLMAGTLTVATAVTAATIATSGTTAAAPTAPCPPFTAVLAPGTGETNPLADPARPAGLLSPTGEGLRARYGADIDIRYLPYPALAVPYPVSAAGGATALTQALTDLCDSTQVVMAGYSQGADIVGTVTASIGQGRGPLPASRVLAVGLIADPRRDPDTPQLGDPVTGQGVAGPREDFGALADRVRTVCATGDLYCATSPTDTPTFAALGRAFTGNPALRGIIDTFATETRGGLDPASVTRQVFIVLSGLAEFAANIPAIVDGLIQLPQRLVAGDIPGAHRISGELNNAFHPLIRMADQVDLHLAARALSMAAPIDPSGWTSIAAQIVDVLARLDITRLARAVGAAQDIAWRAAQKLATGDPINAGIELTGLAPVAADLATAAASALTGTGANRISDLATQITPAPGPTTGKDLAGRAHESTAAAEFYSSGVHQLGYDNAVSRVLDWITTRIDSVR
ncbi:cutinase family protein [Nocardia cyriacigeorgica]|uniref:Cutinase family protein n=1 Tax=Nocardia cyriacigeorgica TaxID=135487 RepID=A0A5R8PDI2_9NOCA|nr:cutinase family protein [Nocardia cyriacigeorgica]TLG10253.1 cutinase family protein [Nocardia cyriacigeorgica]